MEVIFTSDRFERDPAGRELLELFRSPALAGRFGRAVYYYDFPSYSDYETVTHTPSALVLSPAHGALAIRSLTGLEVASGNLGTIDEIDEGISQFCSLLIARLLKSKLLRSGVGKLRFDVTPVIYIHGAIAGANYATEECEIATSTQQLTEILNQHGGENLDSDQMQEARSVIEGAKALTRPIKRVIADPLVQKAAVALSRLEGEITNFDQKQRRAALSTVLGPQRIRGLAGSGKTVILAMKVANLHSRNPDSKILVTFFTKSLNETIRTLITKFYRHYRDVDPNWDNIHVRHGWGGSVKGGVYYDACMRSGVAPLNFSQARSSAAPGIEPFDEACRNYISSPKVKVEYYDYVMIDEGQDFPTSFYELVYSIAKGSRDKKSIIWAYDELQNILDVNIRSPEALFGVDGAGEPLVSLDRAARQLPMGAENDIVLSKCYRNQREVLVVAHALGFGIYSNIVQLLESREHWEDVGYVVERGDLARVGSTIRITRPVDSSPLRLDPIEGFPVIGHYVATDLDGECQWACAQIRSFLAAGLQAQEVLVICLDDRNARSYFKELSQQLAIAGVATHNLLADTYSDPPFFIDDKVTLSTIYRAKGNEAPAVVIVGLDGAGMRTRSGRNKVFTAFTRSKAWVRASGIGDIARAFVAEIDMSLAHFPHLDFEMPNLRDIDFIQRDITEKQARLKRIRNQYLRELKDEGYTEEQALELLEGEANGPARVRN